MPKSPRTHLRDGVSRRDFLAAGGISLMGLPVAERLAEARRRGAAEAPGCVLILLNGGPSPWETFDPKPLAPREIRGPLRSISTALPGVAFCECLPELARRAERLTVVRGLFHTAAPIHETGLQLLQAGELVHKSRPWLSVAQRAAHELPARWEVPTAVVLNGGLCGTGTSAGVGDAGLLIGRPTGPAVVDADGRLAVGTPSAASPAMTEIESETAAVRDRYGESPVGRLLLQTRQLVEQGVRCVTVNTFRQLDGRRTWDAHGCGPSAPATLFDYQSTLGPALDQALAALLDDLTDRGLIDSTLVVCAGEIGRSPAVNAGAGRDHWTEGFSAVLAGGDASPGVVSGETSASGGEIVSDPTPLASLAERMLRFLGLDASAATTALVSASSL